MTRLGHLWGDHLTIDCTACRRHGRYRLDGLMARFGPEISTLDLLRTLTASCRYQRPPGAKAARKYEAQCLAMVTTARPPALEPPVPPGQPYTLEVRYPLSGAVELRLAVLYPLDAALAAFEAVAERYPDREVTLRQVCHVIRRWPRPGDE